MPKVIQLLVVPPPSDRYDAELVALLDDGTAQVCQYHRATLKWNPLPLPGDVTPTPWTKIIGAMPDLPGPGKREGREPFGAAPLPSVIARVMSREEMSDARERESPTPRMPEPPAQAATERETLEQAMAQTPSQEQIAAERRARTPTRDDLERPMSDGVTPQAATEVTHDYVRRMFKLLRAGMLVAEPEGYDALEAYVRQNEARDQWKAVAQKKRAREVARRDAAAQAAPRVEGDGVIRCDECGCGHERACCAEARASALPPGAAEALREWRAMTQLSKDSAIETVEGAGHLPTTAKLLRALASGADGEGA